MTEKALVFAVEAYALVLARMLGFFVQSNVWGSKHISMTIRLGAAIIFSFILLPSVNIYAPFPEDTFRFIILIMQQVLVGLVIGWASYLIISAVQFGGEIIDIQLGLSNAPSFDPSAGGTVNMIRKLQFYVAMTVYVMINGHHWLLKAMARSFEIIPLTGISFPGALVDKLVSMTSEVFVISVMICSPVLASLFVVQVSLGLLARAAPQMNVFMLSFPVNLVVGTTLMITTMAVTVKLLTYYYWAELGDVMEIIKYFQPK